VIDAAKPSRVKNSRSKVKDDRKSFMFCILHHNDGCIVSEAWMIQTIIFGRGSGVDSWSLYASCERS
jgi:hypothetical protein